MTRTTHERQTLYWTLNEAGDPEPCLDAIEWGFWFERASRDRSRIVAQDRDERKGAPDVLVSTVFLGLDHTFTDGPPTLWETMILGGVHDGYQRRYTSRAAALKGHAEACTLVRATQTKIVSGKSRRTKPRT